MFSIIAKLEVIFPPSNNFVVEQDYGSIFGAIPFLTWRMSRGKMSRYVTVDAYSTRRRSGKRMIGPLKYNSSS